MIVCCWFSCVDLEYFKFPDDKSSYFLQFLSVFFFSLQRTHTLLPSLSHTHSHIHACFDSHALAQKHLCAQPADSQRRLIKPPQTQITFFPSIRPSSSTCHLSSSTGSTFPSIRYLFCFQSTLNLLWTMQSPIFFF